jgi:hypothetical protein
MSDHLVGIADDWQVWRCFCVRSAGFPIAPLVDLASVDTSAVTAAEQQLAGACTAARAVRDQHGKVSGFGEALRAARSGKTAREEAALPEPVRSALADVRRVQQDFARALAAYKDAYASALARCNERLGALAATPRFREAMTWQNASFVRRMREHGADAAASRTLLLYAQRYLAKCDTIGFYGPVGFGRIVAGDTPEFTARPGPSLIARRGLYFEHWTLDELARVLAAAHPVARPDFMPRRNPKRDVAAELSSDEARVLARCDGDATARELGVDLDILAKLVERGQVIWTLEVPVGLFRPEAELRRRIERVQDDAARVAMLSALTMLEQRRDAVDAGDADRVLSALGALGDAFAQATGSAAERRGGQVYAGRTLIFEECVRDVDHVVSERWLASLVPALVLVLESARWYTHEISTRYRALFDKIYDELVAKHGPSIPFPVFFAAYAPYGRSAPSLRSISGRPPVVQDVVDELQRRWAELLSIPDGERRVERTSAQLAARARELFAAPDSGLPLFRYHSPDLMIAAASTQAIARGDMLAILGELHAGNNTITSSMLRENTDREELLAARAADLPSTEVYPVFPKDFLNLATMFTYKPQDLLIELADSVRDWPRAQVMQANEVRIEKDAGRLVGRCTRTDRRVDIAQLFSYPLLASCTDHFGIAAEATHTPRITIDRLVVARETWRFSRSELPWTAVKEPTERFLALQRWRAARSLPRFIFIKVPTEKKPIFLDLDNPAFGDLFARQMGRAESVAIQEMLPDPADSWLEDAAGERYACELRLVFRDAR